VSTSSAPTAQTRTSALHVSMVAGEINASLSASVPRNASSLMAGVCPVRKDIMLQDNVSSVKITVKRVL